MQAFLISALTGMFLSVSVSLASATELLMFEQVGCVWCAKWNAAIAPVYPKTSEGKFAPLHRIDIDTGSRKGLHLSAPVHYTPTFVVVQNGTELGRVEGYPGEDFFWGLLDKILIKTTDYKGE